MLVLMVAGILVGGFTNTTNLALLAIRRQTHSLLERWSKLFGGWTPQRRAFHPVAHPKRIERGASRLEAKFPDLAYKQTEIKPNAGAWWMSWTDLILMASSNRVRLKTWTGAI